MKKSHFSLPNLHREDTLAVGDKVLTCTAEGWNGNAVSGHLTDFDTEHRQIKIQPFGDSRGFALKFNQVKRLKVDTQPDVDQEFEPSGILNDPSNPLQSFVVHLRDGALYPGICHGHAKLNYGLWIFPKKSLDNDPYRVFIPKSAVTRFELRRGDEDLIADNDFSETILADVDEVSVEELQSVAPSMVETEEQLHAALDRQAKLKPVPIGEALLGLGKITPPQLATALKSQKDGKRLPLGQMLVEMGLVTQADLQTALARKMGYPFVDLNRFPVDTSALRRIPAAMAMRLKVLPILDLNGTTVVAMADPLQFKVIDELEFSSQRKVVPVVASSTELPTKINKAYREIGMGDLSAAARAAAPKKSPAPNGHDQTAETLGMDALQLAVELSGEVNTTQDEEKPIEQSDNTLVKLINSMITEAYYQRASDIHIEPYPGREKVLIRFRVDGEMRSYLELPSSYRNALVARIKIMCDLDISERRKPQDGKINFAKFGGLAIELRVATIPTANGLEDVVMRVLTSSEPLPLESLNLSEVNLSAFEHIVSRPYGLFLCVGPTGSGKTTTLHSALKRINTPNRKIWTAEDPVEITQRGLRQIQVNPKIGWTFAAALRSLLRADPDVIMVGEIRDQETAEIAIEASLTGHLVFSTLHTNSAAETVVRLIDLGVDPFSFADSLLGILAQRLVRRFCKACVQEEVLSEERLKELMLDYQAQLPDDHALRDDHVLQQSWLERFGRDGRLHMCHADGCEKCGQTGYSGRVALHELLPSTVDLRRLIQTRARPQELQSAAIHEGMRTLRQDGIEKILQGLTSVAEVRANSNS